MRRTFSMVATLGASILLASCSTSTAPCAPPSEAVEAAIIDGVAGINPENESSALVVAPGDHGDGTWYVVGQIEIAGSDGREVAMWRTDADPTAVGFMGNITVANRAAETYRDFDYAYSLGSETVEEDDEVSAADACVQVGR